MELAGVALVEVKENEASKSAESGPAHEAPKNCHVHEHPLARREQGVLAFEQDFYRVPLLFIRPSLVFADGVSVVEVADGCIQDRHRSGRQCFRQEHRHAERLRESESFQTAGRAVQELGEGLADGGEGELAESVTPPSPSMVS